MNVLIIAQYFPPDLGGSATRAYNIAKGLKLNKCNITVITAFPHYPHGKIPKKYRWKPIKIEQLNGIKIIRVFILPLESKGLTKRILLFLTFIISSLFALPIVGKTDIIWCANPDIVAIIPALIYSKLKRCPIVSNVDDLAVEDLFDLNLLKKDTLLSKFIHTLPRILYSKVKALTPVSPGYIKTLVKKYGVNKDKIHVIYGGVDLKTFKPTNPNRQEKDEFIVLYSGAFSTAYNFDQVLMAAKTIEKIDNKIKFIIQGKGELANYIKTKVKKLKLKNVTIIDKLLSRKEVAKLLNQADILLQPLGDYGKPHMGISTKLFEYQAVAKPIICCSNGTPGKYISKTKSGIVVKPGDHKALAKAIIYLKNNPNVRKKMGENGRKHVLKHASIDKIGLKMKLLFKQILKNDAKNV